MAVSNQPTKPNSYSVLLIEADSKQTEMYVDLVREVADCQIDVTSSGDRAFDLVGRSNYHLVVVDTSLLSSSSESLDLLERIKRISPETGVILVSSNATVEEAVAAIRLGAEDYLKKPFSLETFQLAVKRTLDRKTVFGDNTGISSFFNLLNSCQMVSASLEQSKIFNIVQSFFARELRTTHSAIYTLREKDSIRVDDGTRDKRDQAMEEIIDIAIQASNPLPRMTEAGELFRFVERGTITPGLFVFRFKCAANTEYFCVCLSPERPQPLDAFESRLRMLKTQIELTGKNIDEYMGVQSMVYLDDATGLYNTRYMNFVLDREIALSNSSGKSFAILFMDADRFKSVNDNHGHLVGTKILNELGAQLRHYVRGTDTVFRYGGDEFVAVLSSCDLATAQSVAERIRHSIENHSFLAEEGLNLHVTVSIGVALYPDHAKSKKAVMDASDQAMYQAKRTTRNNVYIAPIPQSTEPAEEATVEVADTAPVATGLTSSKEKAESGRRKQRG